MSQSEVSGESKKTKGRIKSLNLPGGGLLKFGRTKSTKDAGSVGTGTDGPFNRQPSLMSRASSRIMSSLAKTEDPLKYARDSFFTYFQDKEPPNYGDMAVEEKNVVVKVLKTTVGSAVPRWTKLKGSVRVGVGRIHIMLRKKNTVTNWVFEIGQLKAVNVKGIYSKEMTLSFHNKNILLRLVLDKRDKCQNLIHQILFEAQAMAVVFHKIVLEKINESWKKALKLDVFDDVITSNQIEPELTEEEEEALIIEDEFLKEIEQLIKEEVDLSVVGRGRDHPDTCEAMDRLGLFLKRLARVGEGERWLEQARIGRERFRKKNRNAYNLEEVNDAESKAKKIELKGIEQVLAEMPGNKQGADYTVRMKYVLNRLEKGVTQPEDQSEGKDDIENLDHML